MRNKHVGSKTEDVAMALGSKNTAAYSSPALQPATATALNGGLPLVLPLPLLLVTIIISIILPPWMLRESQLSNKTWALPHQHSLKTGPKMLVMQPSSFLFPQLESFFWFFQL